MRNDDFTIGQCVLSPGQAPYVVAEIGVNFNGDMELAKQSIAAAASAGADAAKFQTFRADEFMAGSDTIYEYQSAGQTVRESMYEMFKRLELPKSWHQELRGYCNEQGVDFLSSAADTLSAGLLVEVGVPVIKLASEDLINLPLIRHVAGLKTPVILSTGMADGREIDEALDALEGNGCPSVLLLHCVSLYPTPDEDANLSRISTLRNRYGFPVGYSDHTIGADAAVAATALGAVFIEKHFTVDKALHGPDHALSADPTELSELVRRVKRVSVQIGTGVIDPAGREQAARLQFRRSIVASVDIAAGTVITGDMLHLKRPGTGLHPRELDTVIGKRAKRAIRGNQRICLDDINTLT
ncbi:N-acetylneuraminate synthase family protein [Pseudomonadota bacterium]